MRQEWDDIDRLIEESKREIELDSSYNDRLLSRIRKDSYSREQSTIGGFSLIMAGFFALFIYTSDIQFRIANFQAKARSELIELKYDYDSYNILKYFMGE